VIVRIEMLALFTDAGSTASEKAKRSRWFSAISLIEQPVWLHPRSQLMMQNACPLAQRICSVDVESPPLPEQPVATRASRPEKTREERALRMGNWEVLRLVCQSFKGGRICEKGREEGEVGCEAITRGR